MKLSYHYNSVSKAGNQKKMQKNGGVDLICQL